MDDNFYRNLNERFRLNKIPNSIIKNKIVLDVNCDESNYTYALKKLGAKKLYCIYEKKKPNYVNKNYILIKKKIFYHNFKNKKFDFIFYNGGLSHSSNWKKELKILSFLCKKNGYLWLSLYGSCKFWRFTKSFNKKLSLNDAKNFEKVLYIVNWDKNKIKFLKDLFFSKKIFFTKKKFLWNLKKIISQK